MRLIRERLHPPLKSLVGTQVFQGSFAFVSGIKEIVPEKPSCIPTLGAPEKAICAELRGNSLGAIFECIDNLLHPRGADVDVSIG